MINQIKTKLLIFINFCHFKLFGEPMGEKMKIFINHLGWMSFSTIGIIFFSFITNLLAGRLLGPTEYGKYSLILSLGAIFAIPMLFGVNTASVNLISSTAKPSKKKSYTQNTIFLSIIFTLITLSILVIFNSQFITFLNTNKQIYFLLLIYSTFFSLKSASEAIIKGKHHFKFLSFLEFLSSFIIFSVFIIIIFLTKKYQLQSIIIPIFVSLTVYVILFFKKTYKELTNIHINKNTIKIIMNYGKFAALGGISGIAMGNIDKFLINKYMTLADVGVYSIYLSSSSFITNYMLQVFIQVFFPTISSIKNKVIVVNKIIKLMFLTAIPLFLINICSTVFILFLMGNQYEKNIIYIILFSIYSMVLIFSNIFWWTINSLGSAGIKFTSFSGVFIGFLNVILIFIFLFSFNLGIIGIISSLIITNIIMIIVSIIKLNLNK